MTTNHPTLRHGMTLRDQFAISALPISWDAVKIAALNYKIPAREEDIAVSAYQIADAMLKARGEKA